jgi:hypothetical protein
MFAVQPGPGPANVLGGRLRFADEANRYSVFDLNLQLFELPGGLHASWGYSSALFTEGTVRGFAAELTDVVDSVLTDPQIRVGRLLESAVGAGRTR